MISLQSNGYKISWGYDNAGKSKADVKKNNEKQAVMINLLRLKYNNRNFV